MAERLAPLQLQNHAGEPCDKQHFSDTMQTLGQILKSRQPRMESGHPQGLCSKELGIAIEARVELGED
jgi:hypothetical protein